MKNKIIFAVLLTTIFIITSCSDTKKSADSSKFLKTKLTAENIYKVKADISKGDDLELKKNFNKSFSAIYYKVSKVCEKQIMKPGTRPWHQPVLKKLYKCTEKALIKKSNNLTVAEFIKKYSVLKFDETLKVVR